jgi:serine O-acetyltransferase
VPGRIVYQEGVKVNPLDHNRLPDSEAQAIRYLVDRIEALEQELQALKAGQQERAQTPALAHSNSCRMDSKSLEEFLENAIDV